jgi:hypothetical protein
MTIERLVIGGRLSEAETTVAAREYSTAPDVVDSVAALDEVLKLVSKALPIPNVEKLWIHTIYEARL